MRTELLSLVSVVIEHITGSPVDWLRFGSDHSD